VSALKIRIKFRKWGVMKFIGHLDMMRYFQKAIRRADIDICYSNGFSPHQIMSFAAPLGVGITSDGEYFDIEVNTTDTSQNCMKRLNEVMVDGVEVTGYVKLPDNAKTAMAIVAAADYRLSAKEGYSLPLSSDEWADKIRENFTDADSFVIVKQTKKSEREVDLKPLVYAFEAEEGVNGPEFFLRVSTGSIDNIKPELVLASLFEKCGLDYDENAIQIHRMEVYARNEAGELISLLDMGETIEA
jgi:radical SAM-linked protein